MTADIHPTITSYTTKCDLTRRTSQGLKRLTGAAALAPPAEPLQQHADKRHCPDWPATDPFARRNADRRPWVRDRCQPLVRLPQSDAIAKDSLVRCLVVC
jgi:hypothetical protein